MAAARPARWIGGSDEARTVEADWEASGKATGKAGTEGQREKGAPLGRGLGDGEGSRMSLRARIQDIQKYVNPPDAV